MPSNVFDPQWDRETERPPYRWRRAHVGQQAGSRELGASLFEVPPGGSTFPLHAHHANEELLVVLAGRPTLRGVDGERGSRPATSRPSRAAATARTASTTAATSPCAC